MRPVKPDVERVHGIPKEQWDAAIKRLADSRVEQGLPRTVEDPAQLRKIGVLIDAGKRAAAS